MGKRLVDRVARKLLKVKNYERSIKASAARRAAKAGPERRHRACPRAAKLNHDPGCRGNGRTPVRKVASIRARRNLSQAQFATLLAVSVRTLQSWEQGSRKPSKPTMRLLQIFRPTRAIPIRADGAGKAAEIGNATKRQWQKIVPCTHAYQNRAVALKLKIK